MSTWRRDADREVVMGRVQVFDVNETLLDLAGLDPHFERVLGDAGMRRAWFTQMLQSALVATITGAYRPFGEIGLAALAMTAEQAGVELRDPNRDASRSPSKPSNAKPESHTPSSTATPTYAAVSRPCALRAGQPRPLADRDRQHDHLDPDQPDHPAQESTARKSKNFEPHSNKPRRDLELRRELNPARLDRTVFIGAHLTPDGPWQSDPRTEGLGLLVFATGTRFQNRSIRQ
jgi:hypothetical protein